MNAMGPQDVDLELLVDELGKIMRKHLSRAVADLENQFSATLADVLAASEAVRKDAATSSTSASVDALASLERRISRHADHLAALETRLKRVERE